MKKKAIISIVICLLLLNSLGSRLTNEQNNLQLNAQPNTHINNNLKATTYYEKGYQPSQIKHAYGIDKLPMNGEGQKIAIIVAYGSPTIINDVKIFNNQFNLDPTHLEIGYPQGKPNTINTDWSLETSLDVEWVHALAPKASILLVVAKSLSLDNLLNAIDYASISGVQIVSISWGINEFENESLYDNHFKNNNIIYVAAAGDNGPEVNWPAVSPNVLSVGGTTLPLDSKGNLIGKETAWFNSGGGISKYEVEPASQLDYGISTNNYRAVPDVSFDANPATGVTVYCSTCPDNVGWFTLGGTSFAAPAWASFLAIVNDGNTNKLTNVHDKLYKSAKGNKYPMDYRDIINGSIGSDSLNSAHEGYDYVTGLGSPLENTLYKSLVNK